MAVRLHPHARGRMVERGATVDEVRVTVEQGDADWLVITVITRYF